MADAADAFLEAARRLAGMAPAALGEALHAGDYADLFLEASRHAAVYCGQHPTGPPRWRVADRTDAGLGARVATGGRQGFSWVTGGAPDHWRAALEQAAAQLGGTPHAGGRVVLEEHWEDLQLPPDPPEHLSETEIRALLLEAVDAALAADPHVSAAEVEFLASTRRTAVANSEGIFVARVATRIELRLAVTWQGARESTTGVSYRGSCGGFEPLYLAHPARLAREAIEQAYRRHEASPRPAGEYPVVVAGGWGGVLLHEAIGHALEADVAGQGNAHVRVGARIGAPVLTLVDDPTAAGRRGSGTFDDEAAPTRPTVLLHEGEVTALLTDRAAAIRCNLPRTASGRRQDFRHLPQARMSNLRLLPGTSSAEDLFLGISRGLFVHQLGAGRFEPRDGTFQVEVLDARYIEDGCLTTPVCGGILSGTTRSLPAHIDAVARTEVWDEGHGYCEKNGQIVPIGTAMPAVRIHALHYSPAG